MDGETLVRPGEGDADGGRRRRGRILAALAAVVLVVVTTANYAIDRRTDRRADALRNDLLATFTDTTSTELLTGAEPSTGNQMYLGVPSIADLTTIGGTAPDLITADGRTVLARYTVADIRGGRCLVATWTDASFAVADGDDRQCSGGALILD